MCRVYIVGLLECYVITCDHLYAAMYITLGRNEDDKSIYLT